MSIDKLVVRGAREHNLKDVSIELPRNSLVVFTGLSGSGKTKLAQAFATWISESNDQYLLVFYVPTGTSTTALTNYLVAAAGAAGNSIPTNAAGGTFELY